MTNPNIATGDASTQDEIVALKTLLDITKNKLFTAISTINELELLVVMERDKNQKQLNSS